MSKASKLAGEIYGVLHTALCLRFGNAFDGKAGPTAEEMRESDMALIDQGLSGVRDAAHEWASLYSRGRSLAEVTLALKLWETLEIGEAPTKRSSDESK